MTNLKIAIIILAIVSIGLTGMGVQSFAESGISHNSDERSWVTNILNHGNDPTTKIGYGCAHGHMSFGC